MRLSTAVLAATLAASMINPVGAPPAAAAPVTHAVGFDHYSVTVDGRRIYLWSGEFHYWRLPSPDLWRDVLQKMKAAGFNATSIYFDWAYHSPAPGVYDFTGVRDVDRVLRIAEEVGLYVIARPGPYINAETDSGGFPGWLATQQGRARSSAPDYTAAYREWLRHIDPIIARHQLTSGTGSVLLYQAENEYGNNGDPAYMTQLQEQVRADGITVPVMHNYCCGPSTWATGPGSVPIPARDSYPQGFNCGNPTQWRGVDTLTRLRDDVPVFTAEYQGGAFDPWGGPGYEKCRQLIGPDFEKVFYKNNVASGATAQNFYMTFGGTSWGWLADPSQVYSSYDYGAAITETRQLTAKYDEFKRQGYFATTVAPLTKTDPAGSAPTTDPAVLATTRANPDDNTHFYVLRHRDGTSTATNTTHLKIDLGARGSYTHDDTDAALTYTGAGWQHASNQPWTAGDYRDTESFSSNAGESVSLTFTGSSVRWISSLDTNHGIADVFLDGTKVSTVDTYAATKQFQQVLYTAERLPAGEHTLTIVATGARNPAASGAFVVVDAIDTPETSGEVYPEVPQQPGTAITLAGRDAKTLVAGYRMDSQRLQYSTSEIMTHARVGDRDVALLYGRAGQDGETVLRYAEQPRVRVLSGSVASTWDAARGDLRLNYVHGGDPGLAEVLITPSTGVPLLLLLATDEVAAQFWRVDTESGPVLIRGPQLVRTVRSGHGILAITGDLAADTPLSVWAPATDRPVSWNGRPVRTVSNEDGSAVARDPLPGPRPVALPALTGWRFTAATPEADPGFDDGRWALADKATTNNPTKPAAPPVLYADEYGFHHGDVWYRGRFTAAGTETGVALSAITGRAGVYSAWLNGIFLGSSGDSTHRFDFPAGSARPGAENVLAVLVENMGHNEDFNADDSHKQPRGLTGANILGSTAGLGWRIQGTLGGERLVDPVRGPMNTGGQFGERNGFHLPGYPDRSWQPVALPHPDGTPGTSWYRTTFELDLPRKQDVSIGLRFTDDPARHYRALIYLNGWQIGRYVNDIGPQRSFPLPAGLLRTDGRNTLAIAVWNTDTSTGGLGQVSLEQYANHTTDQHVSDVDSPGYDPAAFAVPPATARLSLRAPDAVERGGTGIVSAILAASGRELRDVDVRLSIPDGWAAAPIGSTHADRVPPGGLVKVAWQVTAPAGEQPGAAVFSATASYRVRGRPDQATATTTSGVPIPPPTGVNWVSDLPFTSTNGWGPVERDTSNGENQAGDGRTITLGGTTYAKGLGVHPPGSVTLNLGGNCTRFTATVGVDDEVGSSGSVHFSVLGDGATLAETPTLNGNSPSVPLDVDVTGIRQLDLMIGDAGDGNGLDHSDWAEARLSCAG